MKQNPLEVSAKQYRKDVGNRLLGIGIGFIIGCVLVAAIQGIPMQDLHWGFIVVGIVTFTLGHILETWDDA